jgi:hypothetical protein
MQSYQESRISNLSVSDIIEEIMSLANDYDTNDIDDTQGHNDYSITMLQMLVDELRERNYKQCYEKTED